MFFLHLKYILNKYNIITISLIFIIYFISLIINILNIPSDSTIEVMRNTYFYNVVLLLKLVVIILIVFIVCLSSTNYHESYQLFIINKREKRLKFYLTKILILLIITAIIISILYLLFTLVGLIGGKWFVVERRHIKFFMYLLFNSFMYGMFAYCLIKYLNNLIVIIVPCFIVIFEEAFINSNIIKYISYFFPIIKNSINPMLSYGIIHVIMLILFYIGVGLIKGYTQDIK